MRSHYQKSRQSQSFAKHKRNRKLKVAFLVLISLASWIFALQRLTKIQALTIETVEVFGTDENISNVLRASVMEAMDDNYLGLFSQRSILSYPKTKIIQDIKSSVPSVDSVVLKRKGLHGLVLTVDEKNPIALVCEGLPDFSVSIDDGNSSDAQCYFADSSGYIFKKSDSSIYDNLPKYFLSTSDARSTENGLTGTYATSTSEWNSLQTLVDAMKKNQIMVQSLLFKDDGEYEIFVSNPNIDVSSEKDADIAVIYMNNKRPFSIQLENLVSFWNKMLDLARENKTALRFDYIDVRYGSNVFYQ